MKTARIDPKTLQRASVVLKVIAHPLRLRVIEVLDESPELSVTEIMQKVKVDQVTLSKHLSLLKSRGIVASKICRNQRLYRIAYPNVLNILNCIRCHGGKGK